MNTHNIELPSLPAYETGFMSREAINTMRNYAREAIEADRKRRGEPVAWRYLTPTGWHATTDAARALGVAEHHIIEPLYTAPQPADPDGTLTNEGTKSDDPVGGEYPSNEWVTAFFGSPDDSGFYYFRGDFGNIAHRYKNSAKHLLPQPTDPVVKESLTTEKHKCDGNHGGPRCADPECWNDTPDEQELTATRGTRM